MDKYCWKCDTPYSHTKARRCGKCGKYRKEFAFNSCANKECEDYGVPVEFEQRLCKKCNSFTIIWDDSLWDFDDED